MTWLFGLAACSVFWCSSASALNRDVPLVGLRHTAWTVREGAPAGAVNSIVQTSDGYLWLASYSGLYRFDGLRFDRVNLERSERLSSMIVYDLFAPESGGLWLGFAIGGAGFLDKGRLTVYTDQEGLPVGAVGRFTEAPDGAIWVATTAGVARFKDGRWHSLDLEAALPRGFPRDQIDTFMADGDGTLWVSFRDNLFRLPAGDTAFHGPEPGLVGTIGLSQSAAGALWASDSRGLHFIGQSALPTGKPRSASYGIRFDRDGALWTMQGDGLHRLAYPERIIGKTVAWADIKDVFTEGDGLSSRSSYSSTLQDKEGNFWLATNAGLDRFTERNLASLAVPADLINWNPLFGMAAGESGALWIANTGVLLRRDTDGRYATFKSIAGITCAAPAVDGSIWFAGPDNLWRFSAGDFTRVDLPSGIGHSEIQALTVDGGGATWLSVVHHGIHVRRNNTWMPYGGLDTLPKSAAMTLATDPAGRVWLGYPGNRVAVADGNATRLYTAADGLSVGNATGLYVQRGHTWVGGEFGLAVLDGHTFRTILPETEHAFDGATGIVETAAGDLWINGSAGITHITANAVRTALEHPDVRIAAETFDSLDGLSGTGAQRLRPLPTAVEGTDQRLWFVTNAGIFNIDPQNIVRNPVLPSVHIEALYVGGREMPMSSPLTIPKNSTALRIDYVGLSLSIAEKVRYRYKLEGVDRDWQDAQARHQAFYTNLSPGRYRFRVIASNNDGIWNNEGAALDIVIPPTFRQTRWFDALCIAGMLAVTLGVFRIRLRQSAARLRLRLDERLGERERIARELHDTLLQGTQGLMLQVQAATDTIPTGAPAHAMLEKALERADDIMNEGRDRVLDLRVTMDSYRSLPRSIEEVVQQLGTSMETSDDRATAYRLRVDGEEREVMPDARHEVYCVAREALLNAARHAAAQTVEARVIFSQQELRVVVTDDGVGIDPASAAAQARPGHWGLTGMRERAQKIGAQFEVRRRAGGGTEIVISVPAAVAYRKPAHSLWDALFFWVRS